MKIFCYILGLSLAVACANALCNDKATTAFGAQDEVDFLVSLYKTSFDASDNYIASPISVRYVLAMIYLATKNGSVTETNLKEIAKFSADKSIFLPPLENSQYLKVASKILADQRIPLLQSYVDAVKNGYRSDVEPTDFVNMEGVIEQLNKWVTEKTDGLITEILTKDDVHADLHLMLLNSISFKAMWQKQFLPRYTRADIFTANDVNYDVDMMNQMGCFRTAFLEAENMEVLELPYEDGSDYVMWILLPTWDSNLTQLVDSLSFNTLQTINNEMKYAIAELSIPKFDVSYKTNGKMVLEKMGLKSLFVNNDLHHIFDGTGPVGVSDLFQKARIRLHEGGTEASAVTVAQVRSRIMGVPFIANRPFVFMILQESTKKPIFVGHFSKPAKKH